MLDPPDFMRDSLEMVDDPVSDILRLVSARSAITGGLIAGGSWAIDFPPVEKIKFWGVVRGSCRLVLEGVDEPIRVGAGDAFLFSSPVAMTLASDAEAIPVDVAAVVADGVHGISRIGDGDDFFMIGGTVDLDIACGRLLLDALPRIFHVDGASNDAGVLQWILDRLVWERESDRPGAAATSAQLAHLFFIEMLRAHMARQGNKASGWLGAMSDTRLAPALRLMHANPGRTWHLDDLARAAGMSRATFALNFKTAAGVAPLTYLTEWRMRLATRRLRDDNTPIATLATSLGYSSESAFSNAFRRVTGHPPGYFKSRGKAHGRPAVPGLVGRSATPLA